MMTHKNFIQKRWTVHQRVFFFLIIAVLILGTLNTAKARGWLLPELRSWAVTKNVIQLDSLTLEQKIAQMVIVHGGVWNLDAWRNLQVGGIHLFALEKEKLYVDTITQFQQGMTIPFFVSVDLEGCQNPFALFYNSTSASDIFTVEDALMKGERDGAYLNQLGINLNYAPVVDLGDEIWRCRSFPGNEKNVSVLAASYIKGLQGEQVIATAKHYPGKTLVVHDPHKNLVVASIDRSDIYPYSYLFQESNVSAVMVSHLIVSGEVSSEGKPSVVSSSLVGSVKEKFKGLIISDEINMLGLKNFYKTKEEMYIAVFKAGNDLVLDFNEDPNEVYHMISVVSDAVRLGLIPAAQIDLSVRKILTAKGFSVQ